MKQCEDAGSICEVLCLEMYITLFVTSHLMYFLIILQYE